MNDLPRAPKGRRALLITPEVYESLAAAARRELIHDTDHFITQKQGNKTTVRLRNPNTESGGPGVALIGEFQISVTATELRATPGTLASNAEPETIETTFADGTWYLEAKVTITATTGAITATELQWVDAESTNTTTEYFFTIGQVDVIDDIPDPSTIIQYTYGPIIAVLAGQPDSKWGVILY